MLYKELFSILAKVDSTNNYAMAKVHEGLAKHGNAWFTMDQTAGKGQRGKTWKAEPGSSIILTITVQPPSALPPGYFPFSMAVALATLNFCKNLYGEYWSLKWPNDIYWRDRKAGGILIENSIRGKEWSWAIIGIGLNMNQEAFDPLLPNPVSIHQVTGENYDVVELGRKLHMQVMDAVDGFAVEDSEKIISSYNSNLYRINMPSAFIHRGCEIEAMVTGIAEDGSLITNVGNFAWGEVRWLQ